MRSVTLAWLQLALAAGFLAVGAAFVGSLAAGDVGLHAGTALGFFCLTGAAYSLLRQCFALLARRRARRHGGEGSDAYLRTAKHATLRDSSLVLQTLVAVLTAYLVLH